MSIVKNLEEVLVEGEQRPSSDWGMKIVMNGDCQSYVVWNNKTREALLVDPVHEEIEAISQLMKNLQEYLWLGVVDTHTHADHVSGAAQLAEDWKAPLVMHCESPSKRVKLRVSGLASISSHAGPVQLIPTPGHTPDGICIQWGPFLFTGDTVLFNDVGRDDLPGGNAEQHFRSLEQLKVRIQPHVLVCPGHDFKGGRISSWKSQMNDNSSLNQDAESYIREAEEFDAPPPKLLKKSLAENFK